ncbi:MAG TPA: hypothetical protein VGM31_11125 [Puia sp.]
MTEFLTRDPVTRQIYITDIGHYPKAKFHYVERPGGISQHILIYCIVDLILQNSKNYMPELTYNESRIKLFEDIYSNLEKGYGQDNLRYVNMIFYHFLSSLLYEDKFNYVQYCAQYLSDTHFP